MCEQVSVMLSDGSAILIIRDVAGRLYMDILFCHLLFVVQSYAHEFCSWLGPSGGRGLRLDTSAFLIYLMCRSENRRVC